MRIGVYPGTFDPITNGHLDIIRRGSKLVDKLIVAVARNAGKGPLFSLDERVEMVQDEIDKLNESYKGDGVHGEIVVVSFGNLLMHFVEQNGAATIIRGLRAVSDFEYEFQMVGMNRALDDQIETVFLMADARRQAIASKLVKEIARLGGDVSKFVPGRVNDALRERFGPVNGRA